MRGLLVSLLMLCVAAPAVAAEPKLPVAVQATLDKALENVVANPDLTLRYVERAEVQAKQISNDRLRRIALAKVRWLGAEGWLRNNDTSKAEPLLRDGLRQLQTIAEPLKI